MKVDLTGKKFFMLRVVGFSHRDSKYKAYWKCQCDCGNMHISQGHHLSSGKVKSCGCLRNRKKHEGIINGKKTPEYLAWQNMNARCSRKNHPEYKGYGGRGIKVCEEWRTDFQKFLDHVGEKPEKRMQLDRIDNDLGYIPGNVRWATIGQNTQNRRVMSSTGYKGVGRQILTGRWFAKIGYKGEIIYLGTYDTIEEAAAAYDVAAVRYYGDKAARNNVEAVK